MLKYLAVMACLGVAITGCGSKNGVDSSGAGGSGFQVITADSGSDASTNPNLKGGITPATQALIDKITNQACAGWSSEGENQPAMLDFVLDTSGSMNDSTPNTNGQSKWAITTSALQSAMDQLPPATLVGLLMFPDMITVPNHNTTPIDVSNCINTSAMLPVVPIGPAGSPARAAISSALQTASVMGGTPTDDAYTYALNNGMLPAVQTHFGDRPYMVLITDGQPTISLGCEGTGQESFPVSFQPIIDAITTANAAPNNIKTFVIGSPGSEEQSSTHADGRGNLSNAALAGGTGPAGCSNTGVPEYCHFDMSQVPDFATGLQKALQSIVGQALSCTYTIPPVTVGGGQIDSTNINVIYTANGNANSKLLVGQSNPNCSSGDGWYLDSNNNIVLCPNTCSTVQHDANAALNIYGGCKSIPIIG